MTQETNAHTTYNALALMTATACLAVRRACSVQGAEETRGTGGEAQEPTAPCAQADGLTIEVDIRVPNSDAESEGVTVDFFGLLKHRRSH